MARARNIKPGFFRNADLAELPIEARLLFIGLWTIADREGRMEDRPKQIKMELFPADSLDCDDLLDQLAIVGLERLVFPDVDVAGQDRVDGVVERAAGAVEVILPESSLTHLEEILRPIDYCARLRVGRARRCCCTVRGTAGRCRLGEND